MRLVKGMFFAFPDNSPDILAYIRLWLHETLRVVGDSIGLLLCAAPQPKHRLFYQFIPFFYLLPTTEKFFKKNKKNKNIFIFQPSNLVSRRHFLLILTLERILEYKSKEQFLTNLKTHLFDEFGYTENHIFHNEEMEHFEVGIYGEIDGKNRFFWSTHFVF